MRRPKVKFTGYNARTPGGEWRLEVGFENATLQVSADEAYALRDELALILDSGLPGRAEERGGD